jgi:CBS domain-containing protein
MKVQELMTTDVEACAPTTDLAGVAMTMWRHDCGIVPVVDDDGRLVGVVTDRDICMATATRHRRPEELSAREVMSEKVYTVNPDEELRVALERMQAYKVRRLPVTDEQRRLKGILSINDIVMNARPSTARVSAEPSANDLLAVMKSISQHPLPAVRAARQDALLTA